MNKSRNVLCVIQLSVAILYFFPVGCAKSSRVASKLDAEEAGYALALSRSSAAPTCRKIVEEMSDWRKFNALEDEARKDRILRSLNRSIESLRTNAATNSDLVKRSLPPSSFSEVHESKLRLFGYLNGMSSTIQSDDYSNLEDMCLSFYKLDQERIGKVEAREVMQPSAAEMTLTFQPAFSSALGQGNQGWPVWFGQNNTTWGGRWQPNNSQLTSGFRVAISLSTPIGVLTTAYSSTTGARLLIIRSGGRDRYFTLDRPFKLFVPTDYGVSIEGNGSGTLVIEVLKRSASPAYGFQR